VNTSTAQADKQVTGKNTVSVQNLARADEQRGCSSLSLSKALEYAKKNNHEHLKPASNKQLMLKESWC